MITGLIVKNYRIFDKEHFIELKPLTLFTGTNNSGKSSILNIFNILKLIFHKDQSLANLYENGIDNELIKEFNKYYGGFENLFNNTIEDDKMIIGFRWHESYIDTDLFFKFTFSKKGELLEYLISDTLNPDEEELEIYVDEQTPVDEEEVTKNGTPPLHESILLKCCKEQEYIQVNYVKINQIISKAEKRNIVHKVVCQKLIHFVDNHFGANNINLQREVETFLNEALSKAGNLRIITNKSDFPKSDFNDKSNEINLLNAILLNLDEYNISEQDIIKVVAALDNKIPVSNLFDGLAYNVENELLEILKLSDNFNTVYINEEGLSTNLYQLIQDKLNLKVRQVIKEILTPFLEKRLDDFYKNELSVLGTSLMHDFNVEIEIEKNIDFVDDFFLYDKIDIDQRPFTISYEDKLTNKSEEISKHDSFYDFDDLDINNYVEIDFDVFSQFQFNARFEESDWVTIYNIYLKYYPDCSIDKDDFTKKFNDILCNYFSKVQFGMDHVDYIENPFTLQRAIANDLMDTSSILNFVSKYSIGFLYPNWDVIFHHFTINPTNEYKNIIELIMESDDLFFDNTEKFKAQIKKLSFFLIDYAVADDFSINDKLFLTELYFLLFRKLNVNTPVFVSPVDVESVFKHFQDVFDCRFPDYSFSNFKKMQSGTTYSQREKLLSKYLLNFNWLNKEMESVYVTSTNKLSETRTNILSADDDLSRIISEFHVLKEKQKKEVILHLKKHLTKMEICDDIQLDIQPLTDTFSIYIIKNGIKTLLLDNGYGVINLVMPLLFMAIKMETLSNGVFVLKEPEIGLHPALQSKLADVFVDFIITNRAWYANGDIAYVANGTILIETHSEYLIRKLQYLSVKDKKSIDKKDVVIYYFSHPMKVSENNPRIKKILIKENGSLTDNFGPGFFDESGNIVYELIKLQALNNN